MKVLIYGDSNANFRRFDAAIEKAHAAVGAAATVESVAFPGAHTGTLARHLREFAARRARASIDQIVLIAGINDIVRRRGADTFGRDLAKLIAVAEQLSPNVFVIEIPYFDENARLPTLRQRLTQALFARLFDREPDRVRRYRAAAEAVSARTIETSEFLPRYIPSKFKDGIHLTDDGYSELAEHVAAKLIAQVA